MAFLSLTTTEDKQVVVNVSAIVKAQGEGRQIQVVARHFETYTGDGDSHGNYHGELVDSVRIQLITGEELDVATTLGELLQAIENTRGKGIRGCPGSRPYS